MLAHVTAHTLCKSFTPEGRCHGNALLLAGLCVSDMRGRNDACVALCQTCFASLIHITRCSTNNQCNIRRPADQPQYSKHQAASSPVLAEPHLCVGAVEDEQGLLSWADAPSLHCAHELLCLGGGQLLLYPMDLPQTAWLKRRDRSTSTMHNLCIMMFVVVPC